MTNDIGRVLSAIGHMRTDMAGDIARLRTDVMAKLDRLQEAMTTINDDISLSLQQTNRNRRDSDYTQEEVRGLVSDMAAVQRRLRHLETQMRDLRDVGA